MKDEGESSPYFDLPSVLVPPEVVELENLADGAVDNAPVQKSEEWPEYRVRIFDNDVSFRTPLLSLSVAKCSPR